MAANDSNKELEVYLHVSVWRLETALPYVGRVMPSTAQSPALAPRVLVFCVYIVSSGYFTSSGLPIFVALISIINRTFSDISYRLGKRR